MIHVNADVLVACEYSGRVRDAFISRGISAVSCDLLPTDAPGPHIQADCLDLDVSGVKLLIGHPPCTYLTNAAAGWNQLHTERLVKRQRALEFVEAMWALPVPWAVIENPVGALSRLWQMPSQVIQPYWFGDPYTKATCLWIRGLPNLKPTDIVKPTRGGYVQSISGGRSDTAKRRSLTFLGVANAMADQWRELVRDMERIG